MATGTTFVQDVITGFFANDYVRDYTHAAKTFRTNSYQNAPKLKFLFHVYFEINQAAYKPGLSTGVNFGLAVKSVNLPKFSFDTHVMNQYNRKRIVQTKLKYNPVTINFHDDSGDMVSNMWYNYYTYYYKDANKVQAQQPNQTVAGATDYNYRNLYTPNIVTDTDWGYIGEANFQSGTVSQANQGISKIPFFKSIRIYGFNQHNFIQYALINPMITSFEHDTYDYAQGNGVMENKMTIDYETVKYYEGAMSGGNASNFVPGFGPEANSAPNYDTTRSPLTRPGSTASILGPTGLINTVTGVINDFGANGNVSLNTLQNIGTAYNTFKNQNLKQVVTQDLNTLLKNAFQQTLPGQVRTNTYYPGYGTSPSTAGTAGAPTTGLQTPPNVNPIGSAVPPGGQTG
jgi:hypothetical protein